MKQTFVFLAILLAHTAFSQQNDTPVWSAVSNKVSFKIDSKLNIQIIQPISSRGKAYQHDDKKLLVKGKVMASQGIQTLLVGGTETFVDNAGNFSQEVRIAYLENEIVIKAIDKKNTMTTDTMFVYRPIGVETSIQSRTGKDYALLIGTNEYVNMNQLSNPVFDVRTIAEELSKNYGFEIDTLLNPTMQGIYGEIRKFSVRQFNDDDQLFIFIAGHGQFDPVFKEGYIVPKDGLKGDESNSSYISHSNLRTIINNIPCKHVMLILDVCFGGTFDQFIASRGVDEMTKMERDQFIKRKLKHKTRIYLTSGGKTFVPDGRPGAHSPFARRFIESLRSYGGEDKVLTSNEVLSYVEKVTPEPKHGEFGDNEPGSDFLFIAK